jgi:hypothetical protein
MMPTREGGWLIYSKTITTTRRQGAVQKDIEAYFSALDYELVQSSPTLIFERGGVLTSLFASSPAKQKTRILIDFVSGAEGEMLLEVAMHVNTLLSASFQTDHDFREAELNGLQVALEYGYIDATLSRYAADRAKWYSRTIALIGIAVISSLVAVVTVMIVMSRFGG